MTYDEACGRLGVLYVRWLWRFPALADCVAGVRTLQADCASKGLVSRAEAYAVVAEAMETVEGGTHAD